MNKGNQTAPEFYQLVGINEVLRALTTSELPPVRLGNEIFFQDPFTHTSISADPEGCFSVPHKLPLVLTSDVLRHSCHFACHMSHGPHPAAAPEGQIFRFIIHADRRFSAGCLHDGLGNGGQPSEPQICPLGSSVALITQITDLNF